VCSLRLLYTVIARGKVPKQSHNEIPRGVYPEHKGEIATPSARSDKERRAWNDKVGIVIYGTVHQRAIY
jgi:hypothetical protein